LYGAPSTATASWVTRTANPSGFGDITNVDVQVVDATTPAMIWQPVLVDSKITDWVLGEQLGAGDIGFTWNGAVLTTNQPKPDITATGTQTL
jgi:hypothetical protein